MHALRGVGVRWAREGRADDWLLVSAYGPRPSPHREGPMRYRTTALAAAALLVASFGASCTRRPPPTGPVTGMPTGAGTNCGTITDRRASGAPAGQTVL